MKLAIALVLIPVAFVIVFFVAGITGVLFHVWSTSLNDERIELSDAKIERLRVLLKERKFTEDLSIPYPGATNEASRASAQSAVDRLLNELLATLPRTPNRAVVLREFKKTLASFDTIESEERDRLVLYLAEILKILGIASSGELLNVWRYGFPYGWLRDA